MRAGSRYLWAISTKSGAISRRCAPSTGSISPEWSLLDCLRRKLRRFRARGGGARTPPERIPTLAAWHPPLDTHTQTPKVHDELLDELRMARAMGLDEAVPAG